MSDGVYRCYVENPSLTAALGLVPPKFAEGYAWFLRNQGTTIPRLPFGKGRPQEVSYPLARESGIHSPGASRMRFPGKRYAISVHSSNKDRYDDVAPTFSSDGTWVFTYYGQDNDPKNTGQDYNGWLRANLEDAVPVGVMTKHPTGGIYVWGLAFVETFDPTFCIFTMRGPAGTLEELSEAMGSDCPVATVRSKPNVKREGQGEVVITTRSDLRRTIKL